MSDRRALHPAALLALEFLIIVAAVVVVTYILVTLRLVVLPVVLAIFVSALLVPPVRVLRRTGLPAWLATVITLVGAVGIAAGLLALVVPRVVDQAGDVEREVTAGIDELLGSFNASEAEVNRYLDQGVERLRDNSEAISQGLVSGAVLLAEVIAGLLLAAVLVYFFVSDGARIWRWVVDQAPARHRGDVDALGQRAWRTVSGYLRGVAVVALVDSVLIALVLLIVGVPLVLPLAALTFLGAFFPLVGATIAGAAAALVALVAVGPVAAVIVVVAIVVIQQIEGDLLYPLIVGKAIALHPIAVLLLLAAGGVTAGIVGALLAIPFGAVVWDSVRYLRHERAPPSAA